MSFLYPLGLWGLLGIPVLIIIYIIKSKYTEQTISSTYLWTLSEKFLKRRNPLSRLTGLISLFLQILIVTAISLAIAHPMITLPGTAQEYCFVLDGSGSMQMQYGDHTRFEEGKVRIADTIQNAVDGSVYTLVYVGDYTGVVFEKLEDKEQALLLLEETTPSSSAVTMTDALGIAQAYFNQNTSAKVHLVTDKMYQNITNMKVVEVSSDVENYAVDNVTYTYLNGKLTVNGYLTSYASDAMLTTELYVNDGEELSSMGTVVVAAGKATPFQLTCEVKNFTSFRVVVAESDGLLLDNEVCVYDVKSESSYSTLIVSETPFFFESMFDVLVNAQMDVISHEEYTGQRGYGLYVFDGITPEEMPTDGAVWLINQTATVPDAGFSYQGEITFGKAQPLELSTSTASAVKNLIKDMTGDEVYVARYLKYGLYRNFSTLMSYQGNPVIFAGTNAYGNREVVFAFNIHDSNLPLLYDFTILMRNLVGYSFPDMIEKTTFYCGEEVEINIPANCESIRIDSPSGDGTYLSMETATGRFVPSEVGVHTVTMNVANTQRQFKIHVALQTEERVPLVAEVDIGLQGQATNQGLDGKYDTLTIIMIALAILFLADWGLYCYEKYQLR